MSGMKFREIDLMKNFVKSIYRNFKNEKVTITCKSYFRQNKQNLFHFRDVFVKGTLQDVVSDFQNLMDYCAGDVKATLQVFQKMFPVFLERCPHPVTLSGMLTMSTSYLPVNQSWFQYIDESDKVAEELDSEVDQLILKQAQEVCQLCHDQKYEDDVWLWDLDWSIADL